MSSKPYAQLLLPCLLGLQASAWAQAVPDAGSVRQQIEQQREQKLPAAAPAQRSPQPSALKPQAGLTVTVKAVRTVGNKRLSDADLAPATAEFLDRPLVFADLQRAADAVSSAYQQAGWMARVYLPEQDLGTGVLTLQVVEASYAGQRLEGIPPKRVNPSRIEAMLAAVQPVGQPLNTHAIDRALLLADDLPGVSVTGTLTAGSDQGETALLLRGADDPLVSGDVTADNWGARSTGSERLMAGISINSPFGEGESVALNLLHSRGSDYGRAALSLPVGVQGLRLGLNASSLRYKIIDGPGSTSATPVRGTSDSVGADLSYPLIRARLQNMYLSAALDSKSFVTRDVVLRSDYRSTTLTVGVVGNRFDDRGATSGSVQVLAGNLGSMVAHPLLGSIDHSYRKINYSLSRQQSITTNHSAWLGLSGQHATQVLDSSEKFYIGGATSVRAYPATELGGERGHMLTGEWRWRALPTTVLTAFVDWGHVTSLSTTASEPNAQLNLRGYGLSAGWQGPAGVLVKATWSHRMGHNPRPTATGTDGDGTLRMNRLWLSANLSF